LSNKQNHFILISGYIRKYDSRPWLPLYLSKLEIAKLSISEIY